MLCLAYYNTVFWTLSSPHRCYVLRIITQFFGHFLHPIGVFYVYRRRYIQATAPRRGAMSINYFKCREIIRCEDAQTVPLLLSFGLHIVLVLMLSPFFWTLSSPHRGVMSIEDGIFKRPAPRRGAMSINCFKCRENNTMRRRTNRALLLSFGLHIMLVLMLSPFLVNHFDAEKESISAEILTADPEKR